MSRETSANKGLSPRARGNAAASSRLPLLGGAIPASAGERSGARRLRRHPRGYPRERGGTESLKMRRYVASGLSPRARGNDGPRCRRLCSPGAIPASAGERLGTPWFPLGAGGYPRERGGTSAVGRLAPTIGGLSPRARGNGPPPPRARALRGAIPASAGERIFQGEDRTTVWGYPRERGGTAQEVH